MSNVKSIVLGAGLITMIACGGAGGSSGGGGGYFLVPLVSGANFPTQIRFAPDGRLYYTELTTGKVRVVVNGVLLATPFVTLPVSTMGERGLLGLCFDPNFNSNHYVYVFYSDPSPLRNRVVRFTESNNVGTNETVIVDNLPSADHHDGGRIAFGPDGKLYVTLGDCLDPANSQSESVLPGKILRYEADGSIPSDNPVQDNPLYALGLRNPFGLAFHPISGRVYVSENGPTCDDEIDRVVPHGNYGWRPAQPCNDNDPNFIQPLVRFNPTIAPTGVAFYNGSDFPEFAGSFFMGSFKDGALRRFTLDDSGNFPPISVDVIITGRPGGVIDVTQSPDGGLYISDSSGIFRVVRGS